ncbi:MAG: YpiB family protein, partial [Ruoffia tabacinasalis]
MNIKIGSKKMERNERKRQFLKWLISNYQHSNPSVNYLLQFLSTNSELMNNIL